MSWNTAAGGECSVKRRQIDGLGLSFENQVSRGIREKWGRRMREHREMGLEEIKNKEEVGIGARGRMSDGRRGRRVEEASAQGVLQNHLLPRDSLVFVSGCLWL